MGSGVRADRHGLLLPGGPSPPQLPDVILPPSGEIGGVTGHEVVGCLAPFPLPASQEEHLWGRWERAEEVGEGRSSLQPGSPSPHLGPDLPSTWSLPLRLPLPPPPPDPPSSLSPGVGSRRGTGPGPCPSCPLSAGSALSCPEGPAAARTPGARPLPRVGMWPAPPSGGTEGASAPDTSSPAPSRCPGWDRAGSRPTHRFLCEERTEGSWRAMPGGWGGAGLALTVIS